MTPFETFEHAHRALDRQEFLAQVQDPYLLMDSSNKQNEKTPSFRTVKFTPEALDEPAAPVEVVVPVRKRDGGNAFDMMITLGRATNNDVVIPDKRISKFHAYFRLVDGTWRVFDANSRNGTYVNGAKVPAEGGLELPPCARIKLAKALELEFLEPEQLFGRMRPST